MIGQLPKYLYIHDTKFAIRTDFRDILNILIAYNDPNLTNQEKVFVCLYGIYPDFEKIPQNDYQEAYIKAMEFINANQNKSERITPKVMDWEQDEQLLFSAINKVAGKEVRELEYLHWWTFLGYYMEISEGTYSTVVSLRSKKKRGKKLEKWEQEFWQNNKDICVLKEKLTDEEQEKKDKLNAMLR